MGTPSKKRKLDDSRSPAAGRGLDYFFGKQNQKQSLQTSVGVQETAEQTGEEAELTDEQLAQKLQAEWDQEDAQEPKKGADIETTGLISVPTNGGALKSTTPEKAPSDLVVEGTVPRSFLFQPQGKNTLSLQSAGSADDTISASIPFDESPLTFEPSTYVAELQRHWAAEGGDASYALLTRCFVLVNSTQSRIRIVDTLVNLLRVMIEADPKSLLPAVRTHIILLPFSSLKCGSFLLWVFMFLDTLI